MCVIMKKKTRNIISVLIALLLIPVILYYCIFGFEHLDFTAADVDYMELYSEGLEISTAITAREDIDQLINSVNNCRKKAFDFRLIGSSVPPYGIRFYLSDGNTEEFRFIPKKCNHETRTAVMDEMGHFGFFEGDLYYIFWDLVAKNNADPHVQEMYHYSTNR